MASRAGEGGAGMVTRPCWPNPIPTQDKEVGHDDLSRVPGRQSLGTDRPEAEHGGERNRPGRSPPPVRGHLVNPVNLVQNGAASSGDATRGAETVLVDNLAGIDLRVKNVGQKEEEEKEEQERGFFCHAPTGAPAGALPAQLFHLQNLIAESINLNANNRSY